MTPKGRKALRELLHHAFHLLDDSEVNATTGAVSIDMDIAQADLKGLSKALDDLGINEHEDLDRLLPATVSEKVEHVKAAGQKREHHCHWPGCKEQVPPAKWGCSRHWFKLPKPLRDRIWNTYRPGQEETLTPSEAYLAVAHEVQVWIKQHGGNS